LVVFLDVSRKQRDTSAEFASRPCNKSRSIEPNEQEILYPVGPTHVTIKETLVSLWRNGNQNPASGFGSVPLLKNCFYLSKLTSSPSSACCACSPQPEPLIGDIGMHWRILYIPTVSTRTRDYVLEDAW